MAARDDAIRLAEKLLATDDAQQWEMFAPQAVRDLLRALEAETERVTALEGALERWRRSNGHLVGCLAGNLGGLPEWCADGCKKARALLPETEASDA